MNYLKEYITDTEIANIENQYNDGILTFIKENKTFVAEKLDYLKKEGYIIYPILANNIKIVLEIMPAMLNKIEKMKIKSYNKKQIQMVLMNEELYNKF